MFTYIDAIIIAIALISVIIGVWSGFIRSLTRFCGFFVKIVVSFFLCKPIANLISNKTALGSSLNVKFTDWASGLGENFNVNLKTIDAENLNTFIKDTIGEAKVPKIFRGIVSGMLNITPEQIANTESITLAQIVGKAVCTLVIIVCCFVLIYILLSIIIWLLNRLEKKVLKTTKILSKIDRTLGGVVGLLSAIELIFTICLVISIFRNSTLFEGFFKTLNNSVIGSPLSNFMFSLIDKNFDISATLSEWISSR